MVTLRVKNKFRPLMVSDITPFIRVLEGGGTFMPGKAIAIPYVLICSWKLLGLKGVILSNRCKGRCVSQCKDVWIRGRPWV